MVMMGSQRGEWKQFFGGAFCLLFNARLIVDNNQQFKKKLVVKNCLNKCSPSGAQHLQVKPGMEFWVPDFHEDVPCFPNGNYNFFPGVLCRTLTL